MTYSRQQIELAQFSCYEIIGGIFTNSPDAYVKYNSGDWMHANCLFCMSIFSEATAIRS